MNERTIVITLTETQCNTLANLLDVSVRAGGMQNAKLAVPFITMMEAELQKTQPIPGVVVDNQDPDVTVNQDPATGSVTIKGKDVTGDGP